MDTITVKSALPDGKAAFWERHPAHPGGEVLVKSGETYKVAATLAAKRAIGEGRIVKVGDAPKKDKLTDIDGIGPKTAEALKDAGINSVSELAAAGR